MDFSLLLTGFFITLFAGFIGQLAGGGGGMITIPLLILLGIPPHTAIGSNKTAGLGNVGALIKYIKAKKIHWNWVPVFAIASLIAAWFGAKLVLGIEEDTVKVIISILLLTILPLVFLKKNWGIDRVGRKKEMKGIGVVFYSIAAVIQAAFSAGLGIINTYILVTFFGWTLIEANATRRIPLIVMNIFVLFLFFLAGAVNWSLAIGIFFGQFIGSFIGAHVAIKKGNEFVKIFFVLLIIVSAIKLLL